MTRSVLILGVLFVLAGNLAAKVEVLTFASPENEARYKDLVAELRCLVCQNQNIASSNADLAKDLRQQVYTRIENGESDQQIIQYMVARYGDFVLYKPPLNTATGLLWIGPFALLGVGIVFLIRLIRARKASSEISKAALERARDLLNDNQKTP